MTSAANLSRNPKICTETIYTKYGPEFVPIGIDCPDMDERQKGIAQKIISAITRPISQDEFFVLYSKLRLLSARKETGIDEKLAMHAYYSELRKYPACVVRYAMTMSFKYFPSFYELKEICDADSKVFKILEERFL